MSTETEELTESLYKEIQNDKNRVRVVGSIVGTNADNSSVSLALVDMDFNDKEEAQSFIDSQKQIGHRLIILKPLLKKS